MSQTLQNMIDRYKNGLLERQNLQISNENFSNETICGDGEILYSSTFKNLSLFNVNFRTINFESSFFQGCFFKNCVFDSMILQSGKFENCSLTNCWLRNCNLSKLDFTETTFDGCEFEKAEKGSLTKAWFESCYFIETNFDGFEGMALCETALVDSKFSKFNKSIEFQGDFFLIDILQPLSGMFLE